MIHPEIMLLSSEAWPAQLGDLINQKITSVLREKGHCSLMLTGGRNAANFYKVWGNLPIFREMKDVTFYLGDERCVPLENSASNLGMIKDTLFSKGLPHSCAIFGMNSDGNDYETAASTYEKILPDHIDILLLSVGDDGHIASIFPKSPIVWEKDRKIKFIRRPNEPFYRLTITPRVINNANNIFLLGFGLEKISVLRRALSSPKKIDELPVRLAFRATWLVSESL